MRPRDAAAIGCRLLAIYTTLSTVRSASVVWAQLALRKNAPPGTADMFLDALPPLVWSLAMSAVLMILLWICPQWLLNLIVGQATDSESRDSRTDWAPALLRAVGLFYVLTSFVGFANSYSSSYGAQIPAPGSKLVFWAELLSLTIALGFVIGNKRFVTGLKRFWNVSEEEPKS